MVAAPRLQGQREGVPRLTCSLPASVGVWGVGSQDPRQRWRLQGGAGLPGVQGLRSKLSPLRHPPDRRKWLHSWDVGDPVSPGSFSYSRIFHRRFQNGTQGH